LPYKRWDDLVHFNELIPLNDSDEVLKESEA